MSFEGSFISELNFLQRCLCHVLIFISQIRFRSIMIRYPTKMDRLVSNDAEYVKSLYRKNSRIQM
jgi:hypothetical protein